MVDSRLRQRVLWAVILISAIGFAWVIYFVADYLLVSEQPRSSLDVARVPETFTPETLASPSPTPAAAAPPEPSGKIVFTCTRGGFNHICTINADGTDLRQLTGGSYNDYYASFNRAGTLISFASNRSDVFQIFTMKSDGTQQSMLPINLADIAAPEFSPDDNWIVFAATESDNTSLWLIRPDGSDLRYLFGPGSDIDPTWSPNGNEIAFASDIYGPVELFSIRPDASGLKQITKAAIGIGGRSAWSPDASQLVYYAGPKGDRDIYVVHVLSGISTRLTFGGNNAGPCFSRDGNWIVFASSRDGDHELYLMRSDGTDVRQITFNAEDDWQPRWGP